MRMTMGHHPNVLSVASATEQSSELFIPQSNVDHTQTSGSGDCYSCAGGGGLPGSGSPVSFEFAPFEFASNSGCDLENISL